MPLEKDHLRARAAHTLVKEVAGLQLSSDAHGKEDVRVGPVVLPRAKDGDPSKTKDRFNSHVHSLPVLIHRSGLLQAMAFYRAKAKARTIVYFALINWLRSCREHSGMPALAEGDFELCEQHFEGLIGRPSEQIRVLTSEAQAFLVWLKQFSEASFGEPDKQTDDE